MDTRTAYLYAKQLSNVLTTAKTCCRTEGPDGDTETCWFREAERLLDGRARTLNEFDPERLCLPCRAALFACLTSMALWQLRRVENAAKKGYPERGKTFVEGEHQHDPGDPD